MEVKMMSELMGKIGDHTSALSLSSYLASLIESHSFLYELN